MKLLVCRCATAGAPASPGKIIPMSLSVADMIKLGRLQETSQTTVVKLYTFEMESLTWSQVPLTIEFKEEKEPFGEGGFRTAYKAKTKHPQFSDRSWVIKRYLSKAIDGIERTGQTLEQHTRKVVQMHLLARNFASQLERRVASGEHADIFGQVLRYRTIYYGVSDGEHLTVEEFISGRFRKYINNNGELCVDPSDIIGQKAECLSHFSYEMSQKKLILVDIQGSGNDMFDPEIASVDLFSEEKEGEKEIMYCTGNLTKMAIKKFISQHKCNLFCELAGLNELDQEM